jgi:hypothetical protein
MSLMCFTVEPGALLDVNPEGSTAMPEQLKAPPLSRTAAMVRGTMPSIAVAVPGQEGDSRRRARSSLRRE